MRGCVPRIKSPRRNGQVRKTRSSVRSLVPSSGVPNEGRPAFLGRTGSRGRRVRRTGGACGRRHQPRSTEPSRGLLPEPSKGALMQTLWVCGGPAGPRAPGLRPGPRRGAARASFGRPGRAFGFQQRWVGRHADARAGRHGLARQPRSGLRACTYFFGLVAFVAFATLFVTPKKFRRDAWRSTTPP